MQVEKNDLAPRRQLNECRRQVYRMRRSQRSSPPATVRVDGARSPFARNFSKERAVTAVCPWSAVDRTGGQRGARAELLRPLRRNYPSCGYGKLPFSFSQLLRSFSRRKSLRRFLFTSHGIHRSIHGSLYSSMEHPQPKYNLGDSF